MNLIISVPDDWQPTYLQGEVIKAKFMKHILEHYEAWSGNPSPVPIRIYEGKLNLGLAQILRDVISKYHSWHFTIITGNSDVYAVLKSGPANLTALQVLDRELPKGVDVVQVKFSTL